jgi:glycosyltransferase involved in cell wall biosynthesis
MLADLVLVPSMEEGYGLPLQEAIALRTPVLCSDIAAFRESGAGCAEHFSLDESPRQIACRACAILSTRAAVRRRELLASAATYARAVRALAAE